MKNNGYTRIPNAIIRSKDLTVEEKLTWMYIASMPKGYQFTVGEACAVLRINVKTWRRCVANLKNAGLIGVDFNPGKKNVYRVLTPTISDPGSQTVPLPKETHTPLPKETRGTHYNNKEQLKNNTSTTARACERLVAELMADGRVELALMQYHITVEQYRHLVDEIINDWQFRGLPDSDYNLNHFSIVLRTVMAKQQRNNGTGQQTDGRADKDSTIAQLDRDTLTAMASLARKGQYIDKAPF